jgi:hypothetical protein
MFSLGYLGLLAISAIPLFILYAVACLITMVVAYVVTRASTKFSVNPQVKRMLKYCFTAWTLSVALFFVLGVANYYLYNDSVSGVFRFYPLTAQILLVVPIFLELRQSVFAGSTRVLASPAPRNVISLLIAVLPPVIITSIVLIRDA